MTRGPSPQLVRRDRIPSVAGGEQTAQFPECCLIGNKVADGYIWSFSGVLVDKRVVLTAGHCWRPGFEANVVAVDVGGKDQVTDPHVIRAVRMEPHPTYRETLKLHDIAVMILEADCTLAAPVAITSTDDLRRATKTTLVGFGDSNPFHQGWGVKRAAETLFRSVQGQAGFQPDDEVRFGFDAGSEFVAGGEGKDVCNHDSGGPAYIILDDHTLRVVGITKETIRTVPGHPSIGDGAVFSRIDVNLDFVREVANGSSTL
jgi:secreted trypsin-like serine protease